jgi:hypothetical protein
MLATGDGIAEMIQRFITELGGGSTMGEKIPIRATTSHNTMSKTGTIAP